MSTKETLLLVQIIIGILLSGSILLQVRGSGLGSLFGNVGGEFYRSKRGLEKLLYQATIVLSIMFASNSIAIAYIYSQ
jgi:preprotein translocase subunit SecG